MSRISFSDRLMLIAAEAHSRHALGSFLRAAQRATTVQHGVLIDHVRRNATSDYGRDLGFKHIRTYADFVRQVPLQTYEDISPFIDRVREGDLKALFGRGQAVLMFALTSGTTDRPKYIPVTPRFLKDVRRGWNAFGVKALLDHPGQFLKPILQVSSRMDESMSPAGIPCGAITGLMARTQKKLVRKYYLTPMDVALIDDPVARYYTVMRLAMPHSEIGFTITANPATQLKLARTADDHAAALIRDIHDGTLDSTLEVPAEVRKALAPRLTADPERAAVLQSLADDRGALLPRDYWSIGFLCNWTGGTLGLYLRDFEHYFGATPVRDIGLIASEGRMSIPVEDGTPAGVLEVCGTFYEFIPASENDAVHPRCLRSHEVEVDQEYFLALTNAAGLYRYRIGDMVRVVGFCGEAPIIEFLGKGSHVSSLSGEKLTERQITDAVSEVVERTAIEIRNYVAAPCFADPPFYRIHIEPRERSQASFSHLAHEIDQALSRINIEYAAKRASHRLGPPVINVVPNGYLESRDLSLAARYRAANEQYKHQFLLAQPGSDIDFPIAEGEPQDHNPGRTHERNSQPNSTCPDGVT